MNSGATIWYHKKKCPKCESQLVTDGSKVWCSNTGDRRKRIPKCTYGNTYKVTIEEMPE